MSADVLPFLQVLGLDGEADERLIRRAYAQRLKRIDQAAEPQAFQSLREAYEAALRWAAWRRADAADEGSGESVPAVPAAPMPVSRLSTVIAESAPPVPTSEPRTPEALADAALALLLRHAEAFDTQEAGQQALDQAMAADSLIHLDARSHFEWRVASTLADGWRPGQEFLFWPACATFGWEHERQRLRGFNGAGATIDAAIDQRLLFYRLPPHQLTSYGGLIHRLRHGGEPSASELKDAMPRLQLLWQRYPHWLHVMTPRGSVQRWIDLFSALPDPRQGMAMARAPGHPRQDTRWVPWFRLGGMLCALAFVIGLYHVIAPR